MTSSSRSLLATCAVLLILTGAASTKSSSVGVPQVKPQKKFPRVDTLPSAERSALAHPSAKPSPVTGIPVVRVTPDHGPPGTLVTIEGDGFVDPMWQRLNGYGRPGGHKEYLGLEAMLTNGCDFIVEDTYVASSVTADGHLTARFRVGRKGQCFQTDRTVLRIPPGVYTIHAVCHACAIGLFRVTSD